MAALCEANPLATGLLPEVSFGLPVLSSATSVGLCVSVCVCV